MKKLEQYFGELDYSNWLQIFNCNNMKKSKIIYTIGYSGREISKFLDLLKFLNIKVVVDVRRFPRSKYKGFSREELEKELPRNGLEYVYLGDLLGGFRKGGYEKYTSTDRFKDGIRKLAQIAKEKRTVIMCRERNPKWCHRRYISKALKEMGFQIIDIK